MMSSLEGFSEPEKKESEVEQHHSSLEIVGKAAEVATSFWSEYLKACDKSMTFVREAMEPLMANAIPNTLKLLQGGPDEWRDVAATNLKLTKAIVDASFAATESTLKATQQEQQKFWEAAQKGDDAVYGYLEKTADTLSRMAEGVPDALKSQIGPHFEREEEYEKAFETERFILYRVKSLNDVPVREDAKPAIVLSPLILGDMITALLPKKGEGSVSFVHPFADEGLPIYMLRSKDINAPENRAVRDMTPEKYVDDLAACCDYAKGRHGKEAAVIAVCQGGYLGTLAEISGHLQGKSDKLMKIVTPDDMSRCKLFKDFRSTLPETFRDVRQSMTVEVEGGGRVVRGPMASMGMKNPETENPTTTFFNQYQALQSPKGVSDQTYAIRWWLDNMLDLPPDMVHVSELSADNPISPDGTLPVQLYGQPLNINYIREHPELEVVSYYALNDTVVDVDTATAFNTYLEGCPNHKSIGKKGGHIGLLTRTDRSPDGPLETMKRWDAESRAK